MLSKRSFVAPDKIEGQVDNHCPLEAFKSIAVGRTPQEIFDVRRQTC